MREVLHVLGAAVGALLSLSGFYAAINGADPTDRGLALLLTALLVASTTAHVLALREGR